MADNFSSALSAWKEINLSELQKTLDAQGVELVENQKESVVGRKALADKTREFRKLPDEDKMGEFKSLLKAYQLEIDNLTRRTKSSETAFLSAYKILAEAPDPYPLLEAAVDQLITSTASKDLEAENARLQAENTELKRKVVDFGALEVAKKRAEERFDVLEKRMDDAIREKVALKESELNATYDERILNYEEREKDVSRQLEFVKNQIRDLRSSNESSQAKLLNHSQRQDADVITKLAEMDMLMSDLERANSRVATVERRNEILRAEIESVRGGEGDERTKSLEARVAELETETSSLLRSLETQKLGFEDVEGRLKKRVEEVAKELAQKSSEVESLKNRLKGFADYDEIKRELEIMKYVEFAGMEPDEESLQLPNPASKSTSATSNSKSLETLLSQKNYKLLEELTRFRVLHSELEESFRNSEGELANVRAELERVRVLNERLEGDLISVDRAVAAGGGQGLTNGVGEKERSGTPSQSQDGLAGLNLGSTSDRSVRYTPIPFSSAADTSILPIVTSQRDRFRQRNTELEEELRKQYESISELRTDIKGLQADNLKLYEKIRYMQSYGDNGVIGNNVASTSSGTAYTRAAGGPRGAGGADAVGKYRTLYEQSVNPFEAFRGREAARAVQALNPLERGVLTLTQAILGNRRTRLFFIIYAMSLHALVLFTSYECTSVGGGTPGTVVRGPR